MRRQPNPFIGVNYLPDNPSMAIPPAWFLQRIYDYDAMLVLLPSRQRPFAYVIARRRQFGAGITDKAIEDSITVSDTKMCLLYGLVPVCLMFRTGDRWDADPIIRSLAARDLWAHGGAEKVADQLEAQEEAEKQKTRQAIREQMWHLSGDAYRSYKRRTGQAVSMAEPRAATGHRATANRPPTSGSMSGLGGGALFVHD